MEFKDLPKSLHKVAWEIINLVPDNNTFVVSDYHIQETTHGYIMSITKIHRVKHSPDNDWEILSYDAPRLYTEQIRSLLSSGKIRWIDYGDWKTGKCLNVALERA